MLYIWTKISLNLHVYFERWTNMHEASVQTILPNVSNKNKGCWILCKCKNVSNTAIAYHRVWFQEQWICTNKVCVNRRNIVSLKIGSDFRNNEYAPTRYASIAETLSPLRSGVISGTRNMQQQDMRRLAETLSPLKSVWFQEQWICTNKVCVNRRNIVSMKIGSDFRDNEYAPTRYAPIAETLSLWRSRVISGTMNMQQQYTRRLWEHGRHEESSRSIIAGYLGAISI